MCLINMNLENDTNYIVSGLERSGTSMLMQILKAGNIPISFDKFRKPDDNNPRGYFELEGGKIINKLIPINFRYLYFFKEEKQKRIATPKTPNGNAS